MLRMPCTSLMCFALLVASAREATGESRTWTARNGGFTVEAELVDFKNDTAFLKRTDTGATISVPMDKLSLDDLSYIHQRLRELQSRLSGAALTPDAATQGAPPTSAERGEWVPDPYPEVFDATTVDSASVDIGVSSIVGGRSLLYPTPATPFVAVANSNNWTCYDLRTGRPVGKVITALSYSGSAALSPDGRLLPHENRHQYDVVCFLNGARKILDPREFRKPDGDAPGSLESVQFLDAERILFQYYHTVLIYDLKTDKSTHIHADRSAMLAPSPGGRYLAVVSRKGAVEVLDTHRGMTSVFQQRIASVSDVKGACFSADGRELFALIRVNSDWQGHLWNVETQEHASWSIQLRNVSLPFVPSMRANPWRIVQWLHDESGWLFGGKLILPRDPTKAVVPLNMEASQQEMIRVLDAKRALVIDARSPTLRIVCREMPLAHVSAIAEAVAGGGSVADVLLEKAATVRDAATYLHHGPLVAPASFNYQPAVAPPRVAFADFVPLQRGGHVWISRMWFGGPGCSRAVVEIKDFEKEFTQYPVSRPLGGVQFDTYDVSTGENLGQFDLTYPGRMLSVSPDGLYAAMLLTGVREEDRLDIWSLADSRHVVGFQPNADGAPRERKILAAVMLDAERVLIQQADGAVSLWKIPECERLYTFGADAVAPLISPDRAVLVVRSQGRIILVDPRDGKPLGGLAQPDLVPEFEWTQAVFSADGRRLAMLSGSRSRSEPVSYVFVWDLTSGRVTSQLPIPLAGRHIAWAADGNLLVTDRVNLTTVEQQLPGLGVAPFPTGGSDRVSLIDCLTGCVLWTYAFSGGGVVIPDSAGDRLFHTRGGQGSAKSVLVGVVLPDEATQQMLAGIHPRAPRPLIAPGRSWRLQIDSSAMPALLEPEKVTETLKNQLASHLIRNGMEVKASGADLTLDIRFQSVDTGEHFSFRVMGMVLMPESVPDVLVRCNVQV